MGRLSIYECLQKCIDEANKDDKGQVKGCMSSCEPENYAAPLIWVGFYIAGASLVCMIAMATDLFNGLRMKKSWFPCKFFTLNAAISAVLAIALKMPVDLSTSMPCGRDQLMKLSGTALMSVSMGNFMPSLAAMSDPELFANLMALALFVVPLISNICIQIGTEVIYRGIVVQHVIIISCIIFQFALLVSTAIASPAMKQQLDSAYKEKAWTSTSEEEEQYHQLIINEQLKKHWVMTQTSDPQFVIARSVMSAASSAICVVSVLVLAEAAVQLYITMSKTNNKIFFDPSSEYEWSANLIVLSQMGAVLVGSISPILRWLMVVWFKFAGRSNSSFKDLWTVEDYWTKRLLDLKAVNVEYLSPGHEKLINKFISYGKSKFLNFFTNFQNITVLICGFLCFVSLVFLFPFMFVYEKMVDSNKNINDGPKENTWVLKLYGETELPKKTIKKIVGVFNDYVTQGKKKNVQLHDVQTRSEEEEGKRTYKTIEEEEESTERGVGSDGIKEFISNLIWGLSKMSIEGVSNNSNGVWSTRIVTLSTIACAIKAPAAAAAKEEDDDKFVSMVTDTLQYVRYVEKALCAGRQDDVVIDLGDAATDAWKRCEREILRKNIKSQSPHLGLEKKLENLKSKLSEEDTERKRSLERKHTLERTRSLKRKQSSERKQSLERKQSFEKKEQSSFAGWMNETIDIVKQYLPQQSSSSSNKQEWDEKEVYEKMCGLVLDIIAACLVNLEKAIIRNISNASIEERESVLKYAALISGETEHIRRVVNQKLSSFSFSSSSSSGDVLQASWWKVYEILKLIPLDEAISNAAENQKKKNNKEEEASDHDHRIIDVKNVEPSKS